MTAPTSEPQDVQALRRDLEETSGLRTLVEGRPHVVESTRSPAELLASPDGFRAWLAAQMPARVIGWSETIYGCPITQYLQWHGFETWVGNELMGDPSNERESMPLPAWAQRFTKLVDKTSYGPIRAAHATALLHQACGETRL